jgi:tetratricopeptide (TPR) repeat protein
VLKVSSFAPEVRSEISRFRAQVLLKKGQTALQYKFFDKALTYFNQALELDPNLKFQVGTLRYQTASQLVRQANEIENPENLQLAIQSLEQARELIGGLGRENERILQELKEKLATLEALRIQEKIDARMEAVRQRRATVKRQLQIGMTIPQVQDILGEPEEVIHKPDLNGQDAQLWFYTLPSEKQLQLSFLNFLLFKIEEH